MPLVQQIQEELGDRDDVVLLAFNRGDDHETVREYWDTRGFTFDAVVEPPGHEGDNAEAMGVRGYPTNIVVDTDGTVVYAGVGFEEERIRELLDV